MSSHSLPPTLGYFIFAFLAVTPRTHALRIALWPIVFLLALRAAISVDMSLTDADQRFHNTLFVFSMISVATRTLAWTLAKEPLVRHLHSGKVSQSRIMDALDLAFTLRGLGWEWSRGVYIPRENRPTDRLGFAFHVVCSAAIHALLCGVLHTAIGSFSLTGAGGTIFDDALPFYLRHLRAAVITTSTAFTIYAFIQLCYDTCTLVAVLFLGHAPEQWPPAFDAPWQATSISEFWARRWHQFFRHTFLVQGGYPLAFFFGRPGLVIGTFFSSAILHHIATFVVDGEVAAWRVFIGLGVFAPVVLAENAFKRLTGRRVGGAAGRVWTVAWLLLGGNMYVDGTAKAGMARRLGFMECVVPRRDVVVRLVTRFDAWLHGAI